MRLIPVLDLKDGIAVHARQGDRANYKPLVSELSKNTDAIELVRIFQDRFLFDSVYLADLNAITQCGSNLPAVSRLLTAFPELTFWVDSGFPLPDYSEQDYPNYIPVIGTESITPENLDEFGKLKRRFVLSLDFSAKGFPLDGGGLLADSTKWPQELIVMTLAKVGSGQGPDLSLLSQFIKAHPDHSFTAAGGIRHLKDLESLENIGIKVCLIASALHSGQIRQADIASFQAKKYPG